MSDVVEGRRAVAEALRSGMTVTSLVVAEGVVEDAGIKAVLDAAEERSVPIERRPRRDLDELSVRGSHQGVVALVEPYRYTTLGSIVAAAEGREHALVVALDHVTDPGNLGAVARSAETAGAAGLIIEKRRSASVGPAAFKASAGAVAHLSIASVTNLSRTLRTLKDEGFWIAGASAEAETSLWDAPLEGRVVIVLGAEDRGLSRLVSESCDFLVSLPIAGRVASLNVAQTATVLAYEWVRRGRTA